MMDPMDLVATLSGAAATLRTLASDLEAGCAQLDALDDDMPGPPPTAAEVAQARAAMLALLPPLTRRPPRTSDRVDRVTAVDVHPVCHRRHGQRP